MNVNYHIYTTTQIEVETRDEAETLYNVLRLSGDNQELNIFLSDRDRKRLIKALEVK